MKALSHRVFGRVGGNGFLFNRLVFFDLLHHASIVVAEFCWPTYKIEFETIVRIDLASYG